MGYNIMRTMDFDSFQERTSQKRGGKSLDTRRNENHATYDLPLNVIELSDKVIPCHVGVCSGAVIWVDLHPGRLLGRH